MTPFLLSTALFIGLLIALNLYRVAVGPTAYDRLVATGVIGTKSILLLVVTGTLFERVEFFVDLSIVYALLAFVGTVAAAKYLEHQSGAAQ